MSRSDAVLCVLCARCSCSYASSNSQAVGPVIRRVRRPWWAKVVSLAMDTSRKQKNKNATTRGREEGPTSQTFNLNFGTALLRGELRPRRLENLLAAPVLLEPLAMFIL